MSKSVSEKQLAANRANAQRSTGPRTTEGKSRVRLNSLVHGLCSQDLLLPGEDQSALDQLRQSYIDDYRPAGPAELYCVEKMLQSHWRSRRIGPLESALFRDRSAAASSAGSPDCWDGFSRLSRYEASIDRAFYKALQELRRLQQDRIGFVSQNAVEPDQPVDNVAPSQDCETNSPAPEPSAPAQNGFARHEAPECPSDPPKPRYQVDNGSIYRLFDDGTRQLIRR